MFCFCRRDPCTAVKFAFKVITAAVELKMIVV